jgi:WD40 repeat protein/uncharacterized caspase-like protein
VVHRFSPHGGRPRQCQLSGNGDRLLVSTQDATCLREVTNGTLVNSFPGVHGVLSGDDSCVITCEAPRTSASAKATIWNASTGMVIRSLAGERPLRIADIYWPTASRFIISGKAAGRQLLSVWNTGTGQELFAATVGCRHIVHDNMCRSLLCQRAKDADFALLDSSTGRECWRSPTGIAREPVFQGRGSGDVYLRRHLGLWGQIAVAMSSDGKRIVTTDPVTGVGRIWDTTSGKEIAPLQGHSKPIVEVVFSPDDKQVLSRSLDGSDRLWDAQTGGQIHKTESDRSWLMKSSFSSDGTSVLVSSKGGIRLWNTASGKIRNTFPTDLIQIPINCEGAELSSDGRRLLTRISCAQDPPQEVILWDTSSGRQVRSFHCQKEGTDPFASFTFSFAGFYWFGFSPDGRYALIHDQDTMWVFDAATGREAPRFRGARTRVVGGICGVMTGCDVVPVLSKTNHLVCCVRGNTAVVWDYADSKKITEIAEPTYAITNVEFSPDGRYIWTVCDKFGIARLWSVEGGNLLCSLVCFENGNWVVATPEGRFDTNNLDKITGLRWVVPSDPFVPLPIEIFMRDYYEPRLLARILKGEEFKTIPNLQSLNRVQPTVKIAKIEPQSGQPDEVAVTIEVGSESHSFDHDGKPEVLKSGVYDVRLFRDGQLVGHADDCVLADTSTDQKMLPPFEHIKLPLRPNAKEVEFSAYAFNHARVKSMTYTKSYAIPPRLAPRKRVAYLICMGVSAFDNESWDLGFAASDAQAIATSLKETLKQSGQFDQVISVPLISAAKEARRDGERRMITENTATKANLRAVLGALAGEASDAQLLQRLPGAAGLRKALPEDLVLLAFSTHGCNGNDGQYYLVPSDIGTGYGRHVDEALKRKLISTDELSRWLRDVDAGEMVMIVDACQSAASVEQEEFKPGPMGSRGLGQLAYDKRMRILAASRASESALEDKGIGHGLLTYALLRDGLERSQADFDPSDGRITLGEWLRYGVQRVPVLVDDVVAGRVRAISLSERSPLIPRPKSSQPEQIIQQPSLFDFTKGRDEVLLYK